MIANRVLRRLEEAPDHQFTRRRLLNNLAGSDRSAASVVLDALGDQGMVTATDAGRTSVVIRLVRR